MSINLRALEGFRNAADWTAKGIANLDNYNDVRQNGIYGGRISAIGRSDEDKAANNKIRVELLRALGVALHIADTEPEKVGRPDANKLFEDVFNEIINQDWFNAKEDYDGDVEKLLSDRLLGKTVTITTYNEKTHVFDPELDNKNNPVVRPLTAEDVHNYGKLLYDVIVLGL